LHGLLESGAGAARRDKAPEESSAFRIYVTNEVSGDMTVIDSAT